MQWGGALIENRVSALESEKSRIAYLDVTMTTTTGQAQVNSNSGGVINWQNFISAVVIGVNGIVCDVYTYSNLIYLHFRSTTSLTAIAGTYTVRVWYKVS